MAKKGEVSQFEKQKAAKPTLLSIIESLVDEELREMGFELLEYLASLRSNPSWYATNSYSVSYKGKRVCLIRVDPNYLEYDIKRLKEGKPERADRFIVHIKTPKMSMLSAHLNSISDEERNFYLKALNCRYCSKCKPGITMKLDTMVLADICFKCVSFRNPAREHLNAIKSLIELRRKDIAEG